MIYVKTKPKMDEQVAALLTSTIVLAIVSVLALIGCAFFGMKASQVPSNETKMEKIAPTNAEGGDFEKGKKIELPELAE